MFKDIKTKMQQRFNELQTNGPLFYVAVDKDKVWDIYLNAFPEQYKQENTCNCCKSFIRQFSCIVGIKDNKILTLWDFECEDPEYKDAIKALRDYIVSLPIENIFLNSFAKLGTDKTPDTKRSLVWEHYFVTLPNSAVKRETAIGPAQGNARDNKSVLKRSLEEITDDAVNTVLELISQNSLYRGNEHKASVEALRKIKEEFKKIPKALQDNFCWVKSLNAPVSVCRIRNSSIGTLLNDLSEGRDLDSAVSAFERVVAPANYKRPTALVTPRMLEQAQQRLVELGMMGSLERRLLDGRDLTVENTLFVHRASAGSPSDVFAELKKDTIVNPKSLNKVEELGIQDFVDKVLPTCKSVKVLVEISTCQILSAWSEPRTRMVLPCSNGVTISPGPTQAMLLTPSRNVSRLPEVMLPARCVSVYRGTTTMTWTCMFTNLLIITTFIILTKVSYLHLAVR